MTSVRMMLTEGAFTIKDLAESSLNDGTPIDVPTELLAEWRAARQAYHEAEKRLKKAIGQETLDTLMWM